MEQVLVTGATSGIGEACARAFARTGATVTITGRRADRLEAVAATLVADGAPAVHQRVFDVRDRAAANAALADVPTPTVLVNNAGLAAGTDPVQDGDVDDWDRMVDTNVTGLLSITRALLPRMIEAGAGHIVNIGSTAGHQAYPGGTVYCATKHAVRALTQGMRMDVIGTGVKVSNVDPGLVETEFSVVRLGDREAADGVYAGMTPLTGADIADAVVWVASRPAHVQIAEVVVMPADQASPTMVHRRT